MTTEPQTFKHALQCAGWGYDPDDHPGAVAQRIVRGKQEGPSVFYDQDPTVLDLPTGYDYAKHEEWVVFAWDDTFIYIQDNRGDSTDFIPIPKHPSAYLGERIMVVGDGNWY